MLPQKNGGRYKPLLLNFQTMKMMTDKPQILMLRDNNKDII
jgi:hypothetical protein